MIKIICSWSILFSIVGCTSTEQLRTQPTCSVWKDQPIFGPRSVTVIDHKVSIGGKCLFMFWFCQSTDFRIDEKNQIHGKGSWSLQAERWIATLKENAVVYEPSFIDILAKSTPIELDMQEHKARRTVELQIITDAKSEEELEFSPSCSRVDAAVGAIAILTTENSK